MNLLSSTTTTTTTRPKIIAVKPLKTQVQASNLFPKAIKLPTSSNKKIGFRIIFSCKSNVSSTLSSSSPISSKPTRTGATTTTTTSDYLVSSSSASTQHHWIIIMDKPPEGLCTKPEIINYYVKTLARVLGSEKEAQKCIYDASWQTHFGFCCDVDEEASRELEGLSGVLSVRPDTDIYSAEKDYSFANLQLGNLSTSNGETFQLFSKGKSKYWLVRMEKPAVEVVTKAQMVDYYTQILTKVLGNEKDAQMCIYHISWQNNFGFCCEVDGECAQELAGVPGVLSVDLDENFGSENKDYRGEKSQKSTDSPNSSDTTQTVNIKTKRLFVTGLSFYTSEKTLRAAFEGFGELVQVKIIMDKISKRSKGYAFIEYTTEEAASEALKEMNGKIINGWMIVVDVAKVNPPRYSRGPTRPTV